MGQKKSMVDNLTDMMYREWNLTNSDNNSAHTNRSSHSHPISRKLSDHNNNNNNNNSHNGQHHHSHQHQQLAQSPPMITTTDYSDPTNLPVMHVSQALFNRKSANTGYDTDGGIGTTGITIRRHHSSSNGYEHLVSPRLPSKRSRTKPSQQLPVMPSQRRPSQEIHLTVNPSSGIVQNYEDKDEESIYGNDTHRRHILHSRRIPHSSSATQIHGAHTTHSATIPRHNGALAAIASARPLRLLFMRHSERANQALGSNWFIKAFRTGSYQFYDPNLPKALPKRRFDQAYEFDVPLTGVYIYCFLGHGLLIYMYDVF